MKFINEELKIYEFDYLGNSKQDLPIWEYTKKSYIRSIYDLKNYELFKFK